MACEDEKLVHNIISSNRQLGNKRSFFSPTAIGREIGESIGKIGEVMEAKFVGEETDLFYFIIAY
jgi:hypothetical protein